MASIRPNLQTFFVLLLMVPALAMAQDARYWLERMSGAVQNLDYEGTFVYAHDNQLEAMQIFHQAGRDGDHERLFSLNGAAREVIRDDQKVTCILPDNQSVVVDRSLPRKPFLTDLPDNLGKLDRNYRFEVVGDDRMAGRDARIIAIQPKDDFRYGYRMWLDRETDMLLKSDLTDETGDVVEQVMFTRFRVYDRLPDARLKPSLDGENFVWHEEESRARGPEMDMSVKLQPTHWKIGGLPDGYRLIDHKHHNLPMDPSQVEHLIFSDGLATVSVYIEPDKRHGESLSGESNMGAVNAFGRKIAGYQVTVVGEVPRATVEMIGRSARRVTNSE